MTSRSRRILGGLVLTFISFAASFAAAEVVLRTVADRPNVYTPLYPGTWLFEPDTSIVHGIEGVSRFEVNPAGYRGRAFGPDQDEYRILLVGGSTTECLLLDEPEHWSAIAAASLGRTIDNRELWIGNVGRSGLTARDHVVTTKYLLEQFPRIDLVIILAGVNDLTASLRQGHDYRLPNPITEREAERTQILNAFAISPLGFHRPITSALTPEPEPWFKKLRIADLARRVRMDRRSKNVIEAVTGGNLTTWRNNRQTATNVIDELPDLSRPLLEYRRNLDAIVDAAHAHGTEVVFLTQPTLWRADLSPDALRLLWLGGTGNFQEVPGMTYYSPAALSEAMAAYNAVMLETCNDRRVSCLDLAGTMPADTVMFYDDVHFTEAGSAFIGRALSDHLVSAMPATFTTAAARQDSADRPGQ